MNVSVDNLPLLIGLILLSPPIVSVVGAIGLVEPLGLWRKEVFSRVLGWLGVLGSLVSLLGSIAMALALLQGSGAALVLPLGIGAYLLTDALSTYFILLVNAIAFVSSWNAVGYLRGARPTSRWRSPAAFHLTSQLFHVTMILVPLMNNLVALWIAMQATTLVSTLLVGFEDTRNAREAAWKYLIITSTGIIFALLGTMFLAKAAGNETLISAADAQQQSVMNWTFLMDHAGELESKLVRLSFLFVLVGYGTKAGFAPMHTWLPDGHGEAPPPISAMLSGVLLKSALYAILRFYTITNANLGEHNFTSAVLLGAAILSLLIATPFILKKNRFKRVLAYHSLEHMGIITFGIGIGGPIAMFGALLHVLNHAVTKALMFLAFGNIVRGYARASAQADFAIDQPAGVLRRMPITGAMLTLGGLALVGMPPFNIFMSELMMLWGAVEQLQPLSGGAQPALWWLYMAGVIVFLLSTMLIFYGLVRHLTGIVLQPQPAHERLQERVADLFPIGILMAMVVVFGVWIVPSLSQLIARCVDIVWGAA